MSSSELPPHAIELSVAVEWVNNWRSPDNDHKLVNSEDEVIKGFFIPGDDLTQAMAETGAVNARSYVGIDPDGAFHLLFVGVDEAGNDMVDPLKKQYVYDFTKPCPSMCSSTGSLK